MRLRVLAICLTIAVTSSCKDKDGGKTAPPPPVSTDSEPKPVKDETMDWDRAEQIAREHHLAGGGGPNAQFVRVERVKYLFQVGHWFILVHRSAVITGQGQDVLVSYLYETEAEDRAGFTADDMVALVQLLGAYPPVQGRDPMRFHEATEDPLLLPRLDHDGDRASFHLYYDLTKNEDASEDPDLRTIVEWTLTIEPDGVSRWTEKQRSYHRGRKAFAP